MFTVQGTTAQRCWEQNAALASSSHQLHPVRFAPLDLRFLLPSCQTLILWRLKEEEPVLSWSVRRRSRSEMASDQLWLKCLALTHRRHFGCHFHGYRGGNKHSKSPQILLLQADIFQWQSGTMRRQRENSAVLLAATLKQRPFQPHFCHTLNLLSLLCCAALQTGYSWKTGNKSGHLS